MLQQVPDAVEQAPEPGAKDHGIHLLSIGGKITIGSIDVCEVAFALNDAKISETDANLLLHGHQREPWEHKHANYSLQTISSALEGRGLKIVRKSLNGLWAVVTAEKK